MSYKGTAPNTGDILKWDGSKWISTAGPSVYTMSSARPDVIAVPAPDVNGNVELSAPYIDLSDIATGGIRIGSNLTSGGEYNVLMGRNAAGYARTVSIGGSSLTVPVGYEDSVVIGYTAGGRLTAGLRGPQQAVVLGYAAFGGTHSATINQGGDTVNASAAYNGLIAIGYQAGGTTGIASPIASDRTKNIIIGNQVANSIKSGTQDIHDNIAIGTSAGNGLNGSLPQVNNVIIGNAAGTNVLGSNCVLLGPDAEVGATKDNVLAIKTSGQAIIHGIKGGFANDGICFNFSDVADIVETQNAYACVVSSVTGTSRPLLRLASNPASVNAHRTDIYLNDVNPTHAAGSGDLCCVVSGATSNLWINVSAGGTGTDWRPMALPGSVTDTQSVTGVSDASPVALTKTAMTTIILASPAATPVSYTLRLPNAPLKNDVFVIKDAAGNAATYTLTVSGNGKNIDGASNRAITTNRGSITVVYDGTEWMVI